MGDSEYEIMWVNRQGGSVTFDDQIKDAIATAVKNGWVIQSVAFRSADTLLIVLVR